MHNNNNMGSTGARLDSQNNTFRQGRRMGLKQELVGELPILMIGSREPVLIGDSYANRRPNNLSPLVLSIGGLNGF